MDVKLTVINHAAAWLENTIYSSLKRAIWQAREVPETLVKSEFRLFLRRLLKARAVSHILRPDSSRDDRIEDEI